MIDTVTFDLWNTLISNWPIDHYRYKHMRLEKIMQLFTQKGITVRYDDLSQAYDSGFELCKKTWEINQDLSTEEQLDMILQLLPCEIPKSISSDMMPDMVESFVTPLLEDPPPLIEGARETVERIREEKYKIGLICNTGRTPGSTIRILLERLGMLNCFNLTVFSNELKIRKPDSRIFLHTLNRLRSSPQNSLHVGDMLELDVVGAKGAGMISAYFNLNHAPVERIVPDFTIYHLTELEHILVELNKDNRCEQSSSDFV
jgi:putative hydrolase of the HAD superfamily